MAFDILLNESQDLKIQNGDFDVGESDQQHINHILLAFQGEYKQYPALGVGLAQYLNSTMDGRQLVALKRSIRIQLEYDEFQVDSINFENGELTVNAEKL